MARLVVALCAISTTHALRVAPSIMKKCGLPALLVPASASAASVSYDFGYRLERAIDPDKRGPADDAGAQSLLDMCNPPTPEIEQPAEMATATAAGTAKATVATASVSAKPLSAATTGAATAVAAAVATPVDPASSAEPLFTTLESSSTTLLASFAGDAASVAPVVILLLLIALLADDIVRLLSSD